MPGFISIASAVACLRRLGRFAGLHSVNVAAHFSNAATLAIIAFISLHHVSRELQQRRLVALKVAGLPVMRQWHAIQRADKALLPPAHAMIDFLDQEGWRYLPGA